MGPAQAGSTAPDGSRASHLETPDWSQLCALDCLPTAWAGESRRPHHCGRVTAARPEGCRRGQRVQCPKQAVSIRIGLKMGISVGAVLGAVVATVLSHSPQNEAWPTLHTQLLPAQLVMSVSGSK